MLQKFTISLILFALISRASSGNKEYVINTAQCKIPKIKPFNKEVQHLMLPQLCISCKSSELFTFVEKTKNNSAILVLREDLVPPNVKCFYSYVIPNGDAGIQILQCQPLNQQVILTHDTVKVTCFGDKNTVYENVHQVVTVKKSVKHKIKEHNKTFRPFSVLLIVVDSLSRLNFRRTMPESYRFLKRNNFIAMKGYTRIGTHRKCNPKVAGRLYTCPQMWEDYGSKGYITAYASDYSLTTLIHEKRWFAPTSIDYYFKPYIEAAETLPIKVVTQMPYCTGPESSGERVLNLAKDFATTFKNQSTFAIFWMSTFSYSNINAPREMDGKMKQFFIDLRNEGVFHQSIVVFMSDHGMKFGDILKTTTGWFELRMPVNMIWVPKMFKEKFGEEYDNLVENSHTLTSTHDLFLTLQHILKLSGVSDRLKPSFTCPKCFSLFEEIPRTRSCNDAGIPDKWCSCIKFSEG